MPRKEGDLEDLTPTLQVSAQQSRFHKESVDAPTSKEILIKNLSIQLGQKELLNNAELLLKEGGHYVLVGRNGVGKSTLLKAIAGGHVPGIPWSFNILLLGQTRELSMDEAIGGLSVQDETVLQHVVRSDRTRERLMKESEILSRAVETQNDPTAPVRAYREVSHQRLARRLDEVRQISAKRSGARGAKAKAELVKTEAEFVVSLQRLEADLSEMDPTDLSLETKAAVDILTEVQSILELTDAAASEAKARTVLLGLGFPAEKIDDSTSKLSGGWRTRCDLACALCQTSDILFLDEPSNFLDLPSIIWLQNYIINLTVTTVVVVTHDRDFADAVGEELLVLRKQKIERFKGNLSTYESERIKKGKWLTDMKDASDRQKVHMEKSVQNSISAAKRTGDDKKLKQAASRQKRIDDRTGMQVNEKGHRFKLNRDRAGYGTTNRGAIEIPDFDPPVRFKLPTTPPDLRFPGALVSLEKVSFGYPAAKGKKSKEILYEISLTIHPGERVGICGLNGSGKTTLISLVVGTGEGISGGLNPTKGTITRHPRARFARFSQQVVEELDAFSNANREITALQHMMDFGSMTEKDARPLLGSLGLQGKIASDVPIYALSGGQKVRLALAKLVYQPVSIFVLDEVTTHVDSDTILALVLALREYDGALLVVTHDRFFMRCVVEGVHPARLRTRAGDYDQDNEDDLSSDEDDPRTKGVVYRLAKGELKVLERGMEQYEEICERAAARLTKGQVQ
ncbi:P-loop containing nucleoside triphosphate hydrolase protein [Tothia fuscella]|uniref:P-loop containing nucleoside triphosphate hydrolase protein n=1 Tax=Tothia fuscella TaxID=1048955 RepID=A0A9P4U2S5_9PEZI|nr:P-loop containing nucleoside triphosphate hydrolase protein [Tothia fuscella]